MKHYMSILYAVILSLFIDTSWALEADLYEADNSEAQAREINYLDQPVDIFQVEETHTIHSVTDQDWFRFYVYKKHFDEKGFDIYLKNVSDLDTVFTFESSDGGYYQKVGSPYHYDRFAPAENGYYTLKITADRPVTYTLVLGAADGGGWVRVAGKVVDIDTGDPIANDLQIIDSISGNTNTIPQLNGKFVTLLQAGEHTLRATAPGYQTTESIVDVSSVDRISAIKTVSLYMKKENQLPQASFTYRISTSVTGYIVFLDGSASSDSDGQIHAWQWQSSDNQTASGINASLSFANAGNYQISLQVTDNEGASNRFTQTITIGDNSSNTQNSNSTNNTQTVIDLQTSGILENLQNTSAITGNEHAIILQQQDDKSIAINLGAQSLLFKPLSVTDISQSAGTINPGILIDNDGMLKLISDQGNQVVAAAQIQSFSALSEQLNQSGLHIIPLTDFGQYAVTLDSQDITQSQTLWLSLRPAFIASESQNNLAQTGVGADTGVVANQPVYYHLFQDNHGTKQQYLYPAPANWTELQQGLNQLSTVTQNAQIGIDGIIRVSYINNTSFAFICDYLVKNATTPGSEQAIQIQSISDQNNDGTNDYQIHYADGAIQIMFQLP